MSDIAPICTYLSEWRRSVVTQDIPVCSANTPASLRPTCITQSVVELVINICEELDFSPAIEFTCLDTFDLYIDRFYEQMLRRYDAILTNPPPIPSTSSQAAVSARAQADEWISQEVFQFKQTLMIRLVSILMLSAKLIGNNTHKPTKLKVFCSLLYIMCNHNVVTTEELKATEFEVFSTLNFSIKASGQFQALELFISLANNLPAHLQLDQEQLTQLQVCAVQVLRVAYMSRALIFQRYREKFGQLDWESTVSTMGSKLAIWMPAAALVGATHVCCCNERQCNFIAESVVSESSIAYRPLVQLAVCVREMFDDEEEEYAGSDESGEYLFGSK